MTKEEVLGIEYQAWISSHFPGHQRWMAMDMIYFHPRHKKHYGCSLQYFKDL